MSVEIRRQKLVGSNHVRHALVVDGVEVHSQISPYSDAEIESRVAAHHGQPPVVAPRVDERARAYSIKGGRKKTASVNARGFLWKEGDEE